MNASRLKSTHNNTNNTVTQAIMPPNRPNQKPVYKNGRCINESVAPTSFMTTISSFLLRIFSLIVLPIISTTAKNNSTANNNTKSLATAIKAYSFSNHSISSFPTSTSRCCRNSFSSNPAAVGLACLLVGTTNTTAGRGLFGR